MTMGHEEEQQNNDIDIEAIMADMSPAERFFYRIETILERCIFESRWFLLPLFLGLIVAMFMYSLHFVFMIYEFSVNLFEYQKNDLLLHILTFVDKVLVGGLVIMVIIGSYENSVSRLNISNRQRKLSWLGKLDSTTLKIKLSTAIVSISSVHLLKIFLEVDKYITPNPDIPGEYDTGVLFWTTGIHMVMVITTLLLIAGDRIRGKH